MHGTAPHQPPSGQLSARARRTTEQPIGWLMQQAVEVPDLVSLAAGLVDYATLPVSDVQQLTQAILADAAAARLALQYGTTEGYAPLRQAVAERYLADTAFGADHVIVTNGSQQFLELLGEAIYDPGDIVLIEDPCYFVYTGTLQSFGVEMRGVAYDEQGMVIEDLARCVQRIRDAGKLDRLKAIYTVSYSQNPSGITMSVERREALMALARGLPEHVVVIDDAAYYDLSFDLSRRPPLLATWDASARRVCTGLTMSKPFAPGLKLGYGIVPRHLVPTIKQLKGNHDFGSNNFGQHLCHRAMASGVFDAHAERLRQAYQRKATTLMSALRDAFPTDAIRWYDPRGGLYLWIELPGIDTGPQSPFFAACLEHGVLYVPGHYAYCAEAGRDKPANRARLTYASTPEDRLAEGALRLAAAWRAISG